MRALRECSTNNKILAWLALVNKLQAELNMKDLVLLDKRKEIDRLTENVETWCDSHFTGGGPFAVHFETVERIRTSFEVLLLEGKRDPPHYHDR